MGVEKVHLYLCACAKYPLRTNSAPPNLDEQKREQVSVVALFVWLVLQFGCCWCEERFCGNMLVHLHGVVVHVEMSGNHIWHVVSSGTFRATVAKNTGTGIRAAAECAGSLGACNWLRSGLLGEMASTLSSQPQWVWPFVCFG